MRTGLRGPHQDRDPRNRGMLARLVVASLAGAAILVCLLVATPAGSWAAPSDPITWTVEPADETGPDGRAWVEAGVDGGERITERLAVTNFSDIPVRFRLSAADGYFTDRGRFNMLPANEPSTDAGTWIELPESVEVGSGQTVVVPFVIVVPTDATPGDHAAGVAASVLSTTSPDSDAQVGVDSRVGFRVMLRVSGQLDPVVEITDVSASYQMSWNPLRPGQVTLGYRLSNIGNTRLLIRTTAAASALLGDSPRSDGSDSELLPGEDRTVQGTLAQVWPFGLIRIDLTTNGIAVPPDAEAPAAHREIWVWAMPWPHLIILAGVALLIIAASWGRRRSRAKLAVLLERARQEGARSS